MKTKTTILLLMALFLCTTASSQSYDWGVGGRGGVYNGISVKHFISSDNAIEAIGAVYYGSFFFAGMYQIHNEVPDVQNLYWYYGLGAHLGFLGNRYVPDEPGTQLGVSGNLGIEYRFQRIPLSLGLDLLPAIDVLSHTRFWIGGGIAVRYIF